MRCPEVFGADLDASLSGVLARNLQDSLPIGRSYIGIGYRSPDGDAEHPVASRNIENPTRGRGPPAHFRRHRLSDGCHEGHHGLCEGHPEGMVRSQIAKANRAAIAHKRRRIIRKSAIISGALMKSTMLPIQAGDDLGQERLR